MVSRLKKEFSQRRFVRFSEWMSAALSQVEKEAFVQMAWSAWALQEAVPPPEARLKIKHPAEAVTADFGSPWRIHPWEWETLINLLIATPRHEAMPAIPCDDIEWARHVVGHLRKLEDVESGTYLDDANIRAELHRLGQRQFAWQSGFANQADCYRYLYLYGQGACAEYFEKRYDLSIEAFTKAGFVLFAVLSNRSVVRRPIDFTEVGVTHEIVERAAQIMSLHISQCGEQLSDLNEKTGNLPQPVAYRPSVLREHPILTFGSEHRRLRAPLPPLIMLRITAGLYYDLQGADGGVRNEIAKRFETYSADFLRATMPGFSVEPEYHYKAGSGRRTVATPDILVCREGKLELVIECKATKLTFGAQFSIAPSEAAAGKYEELAKGIFQIWRFYADCRHGKTLHLASDNTHALVLTLDNWLVLSRELQEHVLAIARGRADQEPDMTEADQRPVVFATIQDFERLLRTTDEDGLLTTLSSAAEGGFLGWSLPRGTADSADGAMVSKDYPFDIGDLFPCWHEFF